MRSLLVLLVACGGGSSSPLAGSAGSGSGTSSELTAVAPAKTVGQLTKDERKQLCLDFVAFQKKTAASDDDQRKQTCAFEAAFTALQTPETDTAAVQAACKKSRDECIAKQAPVDKPEMDCNSEDNLAKMAECPSITVAEMTGCVQDMSAVMKKFIATDLCATIEAGKPDSLTKILDTLQSASCKALETKCKPTPPSKEEAAKLNAETVRALGEFSAKMCACKDTACAEGVQTALQAWSGEMQRKAPELQPDAESMKQAGEHMTKFADCQAKLAGAGSDATGSGSAGSGSAK